MSDEPFIGVYLAVKGAQAMSREGKDDPSAPELAKQYMLAEPTAAGRWPKAGLQPKHYAKTTSPVQERVALTR